MAKSKTVTAVAFAALCAGGAGGYMAGSSGYADGVQAREVAAQSFTKEHIDSLRSGERIDNIIMRNGTIVHHWYHTFQTAPHAPACVKFEVR